VDLIYHDLDPEQLRELAPTIPFELIEEFMFIGKASEIADRVSGHSAMAAPGPSPASTTSGSNPVAANVRLRPILADPLQSPRLAIPSSMTPHIDKQ